MDRPARGVRHSIGYDSIVRRSDVRSPDGGAVGSQEAMRNVLEPIRVWVCVVVQIGYDLSGCCFPTDVASTTQAPVFNTDEAGRILFRNLCSS